MRCLRTLRSIRVSRMADTSVAATPVQPGSPAEAPPPPAVPPAGAPGTPISAPGPTPPVADGPARWMEATKEVRKTASWLATGAGAAAAVIFGGGPLLARVDLDPATWSIERIALTIGSAVVGMVGVLLVIAGLVRVQLPIELTLSTLPDGFKNLVKASPQDYLPAESPSLESFKRRLKSFRRAAAVLPGDIAKETDPAQKARLEQTYEVVKKNADLYTARRNELLAQGGYYSSTRLFRTNASWLCGGAVLAVIGATGYLLAISGKPSDSDPPTSGAEIASLVALPGGASDALIQAVGIARCAAEDDPTRIPVLLHGGTGTSADPWQLESLGTPMGCPAVTFTAISEVVQVVKRVPTEHTITYTTTSTTSPSTSDP